MRPAQANDEQLTQHLATALSAGDQSTVDQIMLECDRRDRHHPAAPQGAATLHQAALWYASKGIAVFPLKPRSKQPATRHGFKEATIDQHQIHAWWQAMPQANIGLATGLLFDVADLDGWDGVDAWADLDDTPTILGVVATPRVGGGGRHLYVPLTGNGNRTNILTKVDWRGDGGYVVAPPSVTDDGPYVWLSPLRVDAL